MNLVSRVASSAVGTYAAYLVYGALHPRMLARAHRRDARRRLPGDDIVANPQWRTTFTRIIRAPREKVWPWLVQIGWGRAGYYTWYPYDNGGVPSPDRIVPELQALAVGDVIPDGPRANEGFGVWHVHTLDPPHALILVSKRNLVTGREIAEGDTGRDSYIDSSWGFVLDALPNDRTKVTIRVRAAFHRMRAPLVMARVARILFGVGDAVMEQSLLDGLAKRVEAA